MNIKCVILAAGKNTRLNTGMPKSLLEVNGVSLLERHIQLFKKVGCQEFCVVTGHNHEPIEGMISVLAQKYSVEIFPVHNERYDLENGFSVSVAEEWVNKSASDGFYLTMGDHIFQQSFIQAFNKEVGKGITEELCLAVDVPSELNKHIDIDDVTRVLVESNGKIEQIGKGIDEFNRYDTGLFYLKPGVFDVLKSCFEIGKFTISDMVSTLIRQDQATTLDIVGYLWNDVDNFSDLDNTSKLDF